MPIQLPFFTLLLLISFAAVNGLLFTPALPEIASYFDVDKATSQHTIAWYLIGYAIGQLIYGPLTSRFGRKFALYAGISIQIFSSLLCASSSVTHQFWLLVLARFFVAFGAGVGLKMTFTLVNECYDSRKASKTISYLMVAFAITPGLGVTLGGFLTEYLGWTSCFYAGAIYGAILLFLVSRLPHIPQTLDKQAFQWQHLLHSYKAPFTNTPLLTGGLLMGCASGCLYMFSSVAPFIALHLGMDSSEYGLANLIPAAGILISSLVGAQLVQHYSLYTLVRTGILVNLLGNVLMLIGLYWQLPVIISLFATMMVSYFGLCMVLSNSSTLALSHIKDKAHGSAVMNFCNLSVATLLTLCLGFFNITELLLPILYLGITVVMLLMIRVSSFQNAL